MQITCKEQFYSIKLKLLVVIIVISSQSLYLCYFLFSIFVFYYPQYFCLLFISVLLPYVMVNKNYHFRRETTGKHISIASIQVKSKCLPILLYGLECCNLRSADLHLLDFTYNRLFMKLFRTKSIDVAKDCQYFSMLFSQAFLS